jgi:hypothetical protein
MSASATTDAGDTVGMLGGILLLVFAVLVLTYVLFAKRPFGLSATPFGLWSFVGWAVASGILTGVFFLIDEFVGNKTHLSIFDPFYNTHEFTWAPLTSITVAVVLAINLVSANVLKPYLERQGRNVVAWTTAIVVFTPILAGIVYLLTWPKDKSLKG